jgi:hypothetical protein
MSYTYTIELLPLTGIVLLIRQSGKAYILTS